MGWDDLSVYRDTFVLMAVLDRGRERTEAGLIQSVQVVDG